jgi:hypothetical protein
VRQVRPVVPLINAVAFWLLSGAAMYPAGLLAQQNSAEYLAKHIVPGSTVRISSSGRVAEGELLVADSSSIVIAVLQTQKRFDLGVVDTIWVRRVGTRKHATLNGAVFVGVIGALAGAAFAGVNCEGARPCRAWMLTTPIGAALGAVVGMGVGSALGLRVRWQIAYARE